MGKYDWTTPLPKNVCDGIFKYRIEYRQELYQDQLFLRWAYNQWLDEYEFDDIGTGWNPEKWREFVQWCVDVYMDD